MIVFYKSWRILKTFFWPKNANLASAKPNDAAITGYSINARSQLKYF